MHAYFRSVLYTVCENGGRNGSHSHPFSLFLTHILLHMKTLLQKVSSITVIGLVSSAMVFPPGLLVQAQKHQINANRKVAQAEQKETKPSSDSRRMPQYSLVSGTITSMSGSQLVVKTSDGKSLTVSTDNKTFFFRELWAKSSLGELSIGDSVLIFGALTRDGRLNALYVLDKSIRVETRSGVISSINASNKTFVLKLEDSKTESLTVRVNDQTKIVSQDGKRLKFSDLKTGQHVDVSGILNRENRTLLAHEIRVKIEKPEPLPFSMHGPLVAKSSEHLPAVITVRVDKIEPPIETKSLRSTMPTDLVKIEVDSNTRFVNAAGDRIRYEDLDLGDMLGVNAALRADGSVYGTLVRREADPIEKRSGVISSIDSSNKTFVLKSEDKTSEDRLTVRVNDQTKIVSQDGKSLRFSDLKEGQRVDVSGVLNRERNTLLAHEIRVTLEKPEPLPFSMHGTLLSKSSEHLPSTLTIRVTDIQPPIETKSLARPTDIVTVHVDESTTFIDASGDLMKYEGLSVDDKLGVNAQVEGDGSLHGTLVQDESVR
jgi:hypothetical protein